MNAAVLKLILASASPRRADMLRGVGLTFDTHIADIEEVPAPTESAFDYVKRLAAQKARAVQARLDAASAAVSVVLGADTVVVAAEQILEKPESFEHACEMWQLLSGGQHQVMSGIAVVHRDQWHTEVVTTTVTFAPLGPAQMQAYWATGEPQDKAGGYAIQGRAAAWVTQIDGSASNVIGLPMYELNGLLRPYSLNWL